MVLSGEGTGAAYLGGVMKALSAAGVRVDLVVGRGAGALVAAFSAIDAEERLVGKDGVAAEASERRPFRLRTLYRVAAACLGLSFAAFASPVLLGGLALLMVPISAVLRFVVDDTASPAASWFQRVVALGEPYYLRAIVLPLVVLCVFWLGWVVVTLLRRAPLALPPPFELSRLREIVTTGLWQAVRGTSTDARPGDTGRLGKAYCELLAGSIGQRGFRELIVYALDLDSGREVTFALLKERYVKSLEKSRAGRFERRSEVIDLMVDGGEAIAEALMAALSPAGLVAPVPIRLPLRLVHGGEVHRFGSSAFAGGSAVADAIAAGAEQVIFVSACAPNDRPTGGTLARTTEAALRRSLSNELLEAASRHPTVPLFVVRPDAERLGIFEVNGRAQNGGGLLGLDAVSAHGERDALRRFIEPVLGDDAELSEMAARAAPAPESMAAGPREL